MGKKRGKKKGGGGGKNKPSPQPPQPEPQQPEEAPVTDAPPQQQDAVNAETTEVADVTSESLSPPAPADRPSLDAVADHEESFRNSLLAVIASAKSGDEHDDNENADGGGPVEAANEPTPAQEDVTLEGTNDGHEEEEEDSPKDASEDVAAVPVPEPATNEGEDVATDTADVEKSTKEAQSGANTKKDAEGNAETASTMADDATVPHSNSIEEVVYDGIDGGDEHNHIPADFPDEPVIIASFDSDVASQTASDFTLGGQSTLSKDSAIAALASLSRDPQGDISGGGAVDGSVSPLHLTKGVSAEDDGEESTTNALPPLETSVDDSNDRLSGNDGAESDDEDKHGAAVVAVAAVALGTAGVAAAGVATIAGSGEAEELNATKDIAAAPIIPDEAPQGDDVVDNDRIETGASSPDEKEGSAPEENKGDAATEDLARPSSDYAPEGDSSIQADTDENGGDNPFDSFVSEEAAADDGDNTEKEWVSSVLIAGAAGAAVVGGTAALAANQDNLEDVAIKDSDAAGNTSTSPSSDVDENEAGVEDKVEAEDSGKDSMTSGQFYAHGTFSDDDDSTGGDSKSSDGNGVAAEAIAAAGVATGVAGIAGIAAVGAGGLQPAPEHTLPFTVISSPSNSLVDEGIDKPSADRDIEEGVSNDIPGTGSFAAASSPRHGRSSDKEKNREKSSGNNRKKTPLMAAGALVLLGGIVGLILAFTLGVDKETPATTLTSSPTPFSSEPMPMTPVPLPTSRAPTSAPENEVPTPAPQGNVPTLPQSTVVPTTMVYAETFEGLQTYFGEIVPDPTALEDPDSPQYEAVSWLASDLIAKGGSRRMLQPSSSDEITITQRYVLATLWFATGGSNWTIAVESKDNQWLSAGPECGWKGVICTRRVIAKVRSSLPNLPTQRQNHKKPHLRRRRKLQAITTPNATLAPTTQDTLAPTPSPPTIVVSGLELDESNLTGELPADLVLLSDLKYFAAPDNAIIRIPSELGALSKLERIYLNNNAIGGRIASELGSLSKLVHLRLNDNLFTGKIPSDLGNLLSLDSLELHHTELSGTM